MFSNFAYVGRCRKILGTAQPTPFQAPSPPPGRGPCQRSGCGKLAQVPLCVDTHPGNIAGLHWKACFNSELLFCDTPIQKAKASSQSRVEVPSVRVESSETLVLTDCVGGRANGGGQPANVNFAETPMHKAHPTVKFLPDASKR